jgi:hypothetical protein
VGRCGSGSFLIRAFERVCEHWQERLPPGWKFSSPVLEQDLVFMTDHGKTHITQDELGNTYDRVGGPDSIYKP